MKKKFRYFLLVAVLSYFAVTFGTDSQTVDQRQLEWFGSSTLKGIREIYPQVALEIIEKDENNPNFTPQIGPLTQKNLQKHMEQLLKNSGIRTTSKFNATSANAPLSLNVTVLAKIRDDTALPTYGIYVYTEALQPNILIRDNKIRSFSRTWPMVPIGNGSRTLIFLTPEQIDEKITKEVTRQIRNFIIDYSNANPNRRIILPPIKDSEKEEIETPIESENPEQNAV